jgi:hypothetical protein
MVFKVKSGGVMESFVEIQKANSIAMVIGITPSSPGSQFFRLKISLGIKIIE